MQNSPLIRSSTIFLSTGEWRVFHQVGSPANKVASFHALAERRRRPRLTTQVCWRWMTCLTPTPVTSKINTKCYVDQKDKNHVFLWLISIVITWTCDQFWIDLSNSKKKFSFQNYVTPYYMSESKSLFFKIFVIFY